MTEMTKAERRMVLAAHNEPNRIARGSAFASRGTHMRTILGAQDRGFLGEGFLVTRSGLLAAGVDLDALYEEALDEDEARTIVHAVDGMARAMAKRVTELRASATFDHNPERYPACAGRRCVCLKAAHGGALRSY